MGQLALIGMGHLLMLLFSFPDTDGFVIPSLSIGEPNQSISDISNITDTKRIEKVNSAYIGVFLKWSVITLFFRERNKYLFHITV